MDERLQAELTRPHFIEVGPRASAADFESYVSQVGIEERRAASAYVFRILSVQLESLRDVEAGLALTELQRKVSALPLFALCLDGVHQLHRIEGISVSRISTEDESSAVNLIRSFDLRGVVHEAEDLCYFRATQVQHFIAPSGEHCEVFFRLGDAIRSKRALDRLVFWTAPIFASAGGVIVDNWSIAALALRALQQANRNTPFDCLASHPQRDRRDAEVIISRMIKYELAPESTLVFVVSVTSSGSYASIVREIAREYLPESRIEVIAIYGLAGTPASVDRLCTLDFAPQNVHPEACRLCASGKSAAVPLDPGLYYLKAYPEKPVMLRKEHFELRSFFDRYHALPGLFSVHRDDRLRRHHAFHVNLRALLHGAPEFEERCREALRRVGKSVDLLVTPADDVSQLGALATQQLSVTRIAADSLRNLSSEDSAALRRAQHILIVDDVLVSGSRIEGYVTALREQPNKPKSVNILVGLGRPPSPDALQRHRTAWTTNIPWSAELVVLEEFYLPDWQASECPWCHEFDLLSEAAQGIAEPPQWLSERIGRLTEREHRGVIEGPLLLLPGVPERNLGHGSLVGPVGTSAMASLFSVASALQCLRNDPKVERRLDARFPLYQVMAAQNIKNYSESLLRAVLLRAVAPREWGVGEQQSLSKLLVGIYRRGEDAEFLSGEVLVATARGALDRSALGALKPLLEKRHPAANAVFRALVTPEAHREPPVAAPAHARSRRWLYVAVALVVGAALLWLLLWR